MLLLCLLRRGAAKLCFVACFDGRFGAALRFPACVGFSAALAGSSCVLRTYSQRTATFAVFVDRD